jgi:hypothetical protein
MTGLSAKAVFAEGLALGKAGLSAKLAFPVVTLNFATCIIKTFESSQIEFRFYSEICKFLI